MIGQLLADTTPGTHPTITICGGGGFLCTYDLDTLISSAIAIAMTLAIGFLLVRTLRSGKPGRLQMVFELFLSYIRNLIRDGIREGNADEHKSPISEQRLVPIAVLDYIRSRGLYR